MKKAPESLLFKEGWGMTEVLINQSYILDAFLKLLQGRRWCLQRGPVPQSPGAWQRQYRPPQLQVTPLQVCKL